MKLLILFSILSLSFTSQAATKCSEENITALLRHTVQLLGENTIQNVQVSQLVSDLNKKNLSAAKFKKEYWTIAKKRIIATQESISKIGAIAKANPECDLDSMFTTK